MPPIDANKLLTILNAANSPSFKKLLEDREGAQKGLDDARAHLADAENRLNANIPAELKALLLPPAPKAVKPRASASDGNLKKPDLQELKAILDGLPDKTLNIRQQGYETRNIKILAEANPHLFRYEKGAWPKVTYLR